MKMKYLFILFGVILGAVQFLLLRRFTSKILSGDKKVILIILAKLFIYAAAVAVMMLFFKEYVLFFGIGLGAAMMLGAVINFALTYKSENKGDDAS